jgi:hypothetical protein
MEGTLDANSSCGFQPDEALAGRRADRRAWARDGRRASEVERVGSDPAGTT